MGSTEGGDTTEEPWQAFRALDPDASMGDITPHLEKCPHFCIISSRRDSSLASALPSPSRDWVMIHPYQKLPGPNYLRLLEVQDADGIMSFCLKTMLLDEARDKFVAISYCWGTEPPSRLLPLADGTCIRIKADVESLISRVFTDCVPGELLWIDAICINQEDVDEKSEQVRIMNEIYGAARRVSVWLGKPDGDEEEVATHLAHFYFGYVDNIHIAHVPLEKGNTVNWDRGPDSVRKAAESWAHLVSLPWFVRVWVIQEVCFGKLVWFHYGRLIVTFAAFSQSFSKIQQRLGDNFAGPDGAIRQGFKIFNHYYSVREFVATPRGPKSSYDYAFSLENIHSRFAFTLATDPRDRIFALLNISDARLHGSCILPDYRSSTWDTFVHAAVAILTHSPRLELLGYAGLANGLSSSSGKHLPSWVPDFASLSSFFPLNLSAEPNRQLYKAASTKRSWVQLAAWCQLDDQHAGSWYFHLDKCPTFARHARYHGLSCPATSEIIPCPGIFHRHDLAIYGRHIDTITAAARGNPNSVARPFPWTKPNDTAVMIKYRVLTIQGWIRLLEATLSMVGSLLPYPTGEGSASEITLRTLTVNRFHEGVRTRAPRSGELPDAEVLLARLKEMLEMIEQEEEKEEEEKEEEEKEEEEEEQEESGERKRACERKKPRTEAVLCDLLIHKLSTRASGSPCSDKRSDAGSKLEAASPDPPPTEGRGGDNIRGNGLPEWDAPFWTALDQTYSGTERRVFRTGRGYIGIGREALQEGDEIWLFNGASVPFLVRRSSMFMGEQLRQLVCDCYVHGLMQGEGMEVEGVEEGVVLLE